MFLTLHKEILCCLMTGTEGKLCVPCDRKDVSGALTPAGTPAALGLLCGTL